MEPFIFDRDDELVLEVPELLSEKPKSDNGRNIRQICKHFKHAY